MSDEGIRIKRHPDGTRYVQPYLGTNKATGRKIRPYKSFPAHMSDEEVEREARTWLAGMKNATSWGTPVYLGDLLEQYVDRLEMEGSPANTVREYRTYTRRYAAPIAKVDARKVTPLDLEDLYHHLLRSGREDGTGLSPNTVRSFHQFLGGAYKRLVRNGICDSDPTDYAVPPAPSPTEAVSLDDEGFSTIMAALRDEVSTYPENRAARSRRCAAFAAYLALNTGMRCGEVCALRRCDVFPDAGYLRVSGTVTEAGEVRRQPKTKGRRSRNVSVTPEVLSEISRIEAWQSMLVRKAGPKTPLVTTDGSWMRPSYVSRVFSRIRDERGLPPECTFHSLRHTHATWLLANGVDVRTVAERLGHSKPSMTLNIYGHVLPGRDAAAAELFGRLAGDARGD